MLTLKIILKKEKEYSSRVYTQLIEKKFNNTVSRLKKSKLFEKKPCNNCLQKKLCSSCYFNQIF